MPFGTKKIGSRNTINHTVPINTLFPVRAGLRKINSAVITTAAIPQPVLVLSIVGKTSRLNGKMHFPKYCINPTERSSIREIISLFISDGALCGNTFLLATNHIVHAIAFNAMTKKVTKDEG